MEINSAVRAGFFPDLSSVDRSPSPGPEHEAAASQAPDTGVLQIEVKPRANPAADALAAKQAEISPSGVRIRVDDATHQVITQILNESNEVIRQLPPEDALKIAARFRQITGLIFDLNV